ncbi:homospermidine synthase [Pseudomonas sp. SWRI111]|uniref:saccharopine dehydrogenase C-terminal domain-containing protein n=1 Tax=Pseudomonas sp. SWRI111 TaxID=2745507 RepID=UPI001645F1BF|nr:saccharopine dehydrogenase C-terminal domain-containing protein [Pseudomonas sp. SWRI111]MBC3207476.1 homospermidine synthase [Pseudomonas sp. SWRI111]
MPAVQRQPFCARLIIIGYGSIGRGVLPLLLRHIELDPAQVWVICPSGAAEQAARDYGVQVEQQALTADNFHACLEPKLRAGDFLLNLSIEVSSQALLAFCQTRDVLYLDTCTEPWAGGYDSAEQPPQACTNYALRHGILALRGAQDSATAILTHGANPGLVSHLVKQALENLAADIGQQHSVCTSRADWARLAQALKVKVIHIAEYDSQYAARRKEPGEFVNTWSVEGFIAEACQPAELGWGSHERALPADARRHPYGSQAAIYLQRPGAATQVRTWTPGVGPTLGFLVTHSEAISIAEYLTVGEGAHPDYRPTVHYAYRPCDDALLSLHELAARQWQPQPQQRLLDDDIAGGRDELGVLLLGHGKTAYWYGSTLSIDQARALCPHNSATSLQVTAAVMAGVVWTIRNPRRGILEPDELPHREILELCRPYLGPLQGFYSDWTPLAQRHVGIDPPGDEQDPWQFRNLRFT